MEDSVRASARLIDLEIPDDCLPGVIESIEALRTHLQTLEKPEPNS